MSYEIHVFPPTNLLKRKFWLSFRCRTAGRI